MEIQLKLVEATARHARYVLGEAVDMECNGCLVDHPSQLQHECVMLSGEDRIRFCLDRALLLLDWIEVKQEFWNNVTLDPSCCHECFHDVEWYKTLWNDEDWWEQLVSALMAQESRLFDM